MRRAIAVVALGLVATAGCASGHHAAAPDPAVTGPQSTFVVLGGSESLGARGADRLRDTWPYLVYQSAFPVGTALVNAAVPRATVASALNDEMPLVREVKPQTAAVLLGAQDVAARTPVADFARDYGALVAALRAAGVRKLVFAEVPKSYGDAGPYDDVIASEARANGGQLAKLRDTSIALVAGVGDGERLPATPGQQAIAAAVEDALHR